MYDPPHNSNATKTLATHKHEERTTQITPDQYQIAKKHGSFWKRGLRLGGGAGAGFSNALHIGMHEMKRRGLASFNELHDVLKRELEAGTLEG